MIILSENLAAAANGDRNGQHGSAPPGFESSTDKPGSAANSAGVFMPTEKKKQKNGRFSDFFVSKQQCGTCGNLANHLPAFCPENPKRKALKAALEKARADLDA